MRIEGKTALITGGSKGIGLAIAESMLQEGMKVAITGSSSKVLEVVETLNHKYPGNIMGFQADVRNLESQQEVVASIIDAWNGLDVLIANAGVGYFAAIDEMTADQWNQTIDINLTGVFNSVKASVDALKISKGYFISIASLAGTNFFAKGAAYNASKFGLVGFTQAVMMDLREYDVKTTTIMPGSVSTYFNNNVPSEKDAWKIQPEDIGQMVIDLLKMPSRSLPSKVEVRPSFPHKK